MDIRPSARITIGITGSSGLVGSALASRLAADGRRVIRLRRANGPGLSFQTTKDDLDLPSLPLEAVVHLAGEPIASGRWTSEKKARILTSRVEGTRNLCQALAQSDSPPRILVCASAVGFYGDRGDAFLDERSGPGKGFLPEVVRAWEDSTQPAVESGIRVVCLRFGMILSAAGGALAKMLRPFHWGLGGRIGTGRQYWSWIDLDDALGAICHVLMTDSLSGPVNAVAPEPVTNAEFTAALGRAVGRPAVVPVPAWAARAAFGQMADELLLASARVAPRRLMESGYVFRHGQLDDALRHLLGQQ